MWRGKAQRSYYPVFKKITLASRKCKAFIKGWRLRKTL
jgi:hypothetical protein